MARAGDDVVDVALLDDLPLEHHRHPSADLTHDGEVVGDEHRRPVGQLVGEQLQDLALDQDVERGGGLVAQHQAGTVGQRHGDECALPLAPRQLVRVGAGDPLRLGDPDATEPGEHLVVDASPAFAVVQRHHLPHLPAHLHGGIQGGHRLLEDHRHLVAPESAHLVLGEPHELAAVEPDAAGDVRVGGQEAHDRERRHGLARPGLADDPQPFPFVEGEADAPQGGLLPTAEGDAQVRDFEVAHRISLSLGSSRSRRPSPRRLKPMVVTAIARPGQSASWGALKM